MLGQRSGAVLKVALLLAAVGCLALLAGHTPDSSEGPRRLHEYKEPSGGHGSDGHAGHREHAGHEGHEGHQGHHGHEEHGQCPLEGHNRGLNQVGKVTVATAVMLVCFLGLEMLLLYLVNFRDPHVRSYIWQMISSTISIFLAVLINHAFHELIFVQVIPSPSPRGLSICLSEVQKSVILAIMLLLSFGIIYLIGYGCHRLNWNPYAGCTICGHLTGFAGIRFWGGLQQWHHNDRMPFEHVSLVLFVAMLMTLALNIARKKLVGCFPPTKREPQEYQSVEEPPPGSTNDHAHEKWKHLAEEAWMDACAMYLSFCTSQCLMVGILGYMAPIHYSSEPRKPADIQCMLLLGAALLVILMCGTIVRHLLAKRHNLDEKHPNAEGIAEWLQMYCTMTLCWVMLRIFCWAIKMLLKDAKDLLQVVTAAAVTTFGVVAIIGIDKLADMMPERFNNKRNTRSEDNNIMYDNMSNNKIGQPQAMLGKMSMSKIVDVDMLPIDEMERALRTLIGGISLLVGVSWERAFEAANAAIVDGVPVLSNHKVITIFGLACFFFFIVTPAWILYIVPKAQMEPEEHDMIISLEDVTASMAGHTKFSPHKAFVKQTVTWTNEDMLMMFAAALAERNIKPEDFHIKITELARTAESHPEALNTRLKPTLSKALTQHFKESHVADMH